jgi:hypothetical protein
MGVLNLSDASIKSGGKRTTFWDQETAWNEGLQLIQTTSFSSAASVSLDNVFSDDYVQYKIVSKITSVSANAYNYLRLRAGGTDTTTGYNIQYLVAAGTGKSAARDTNFPHFLQLGYILSGINEGVSIAEILNPFQATYTSGVSQSADRPESANPEVKFWAAGTDGTTQYDGFTLIPSTGTFTGTVSVYGYYKG